MATTVRKLQLLPGGSDSASALTLPARGPRLRVAIASRDGKSLNAHFGFAEKLMVYDVTRTAHRLVQVVTASVSHDPGCEKAGHEGAIAAKVAALAGCHLLFALAIGPAAAARVLRANMYPIKVAEPEPIGAVISRAQSMMSGTPPPWLRKVLTDHPRHP
jgi:nitrogen fixation protein NifX